jgi:hypothetical protein
VIVSSLVEGFPTTAMKMVFGVGPYYLFGFWIFGREEEFRAKTSNSKIKSR